MTHDFVCNLTPLANLVRKGIATLGIGIFATLITSDSLSAAEITHPKNVVELFTSQGCHSCPPADKLLGDLSKTDDTLALAWHVDYWDYLGWKDAFGSKANTERQYRYAASLKERQVYTPQAIINGRKHVVGSDEKALLSTLKRFSGSDNGLTVPINAKVNGEALELSIESNANSKDTTLWLIYFSDEQQVDIKRGENSGKKITYHNIVREFEMLGMVNLSNMNVNLPISEMRRKGYTSWALLLQKSTAHGTPGPIVGATIVKDL